MFNVGEDDGEITNTASSKQIILTEFSRTDTAFQTTQGMMLLAHPQPVMLKEVGVEAVVLAATPPQATRDPPTGATSATKPGTSLVLVPVSGHSKIYAE